MNTHMNTHMMTGPSPLDLLHPGQASHTAVKSGNWSDPSTWQNGKVPGAGADVYIGQNFDVRYDAASNVELGIVRVDGGLNFATNIDTKMVVDTVVTGMMSTLTIGTSSNPVNANVNTEIVFTVWSWCRDDGSSRDPWCSEGIVSQALN